VVITAAALEGIAIINTITDETIPMRRLARDSGAKSGKEVR
jgi:hypothetical protein